MGGPARAADAAVCAPVVRGDERGLLADLAHAGLPVDDLPGAQILSTVNKCRGNNIAIAHGIWRLPQVTNRHREYITGYEKPERVAS